MPRVTRAQAEAVTTALANKAALYDLQFENRASYDRYVEETRRWRNTLRAYLAQRPDEETIRKGHECLHLMSSWARSLAEWEAVRRRVTEDEEAIKAAMYQPEEEA